MRPSENRRGLGAVTPSCDNLAEVALSIRKRHLRSLLDEAWDVLQRMRTARRSRSRRARLLLLARRHRLRRCLRLLRPPGLTLERCGGRSYVAYDPAIPRCCRQGLRETMNRIRRDWHDTKASSLDAILGNLTSLVEETEPVPGRPLSVGWTLREIELAGVWIGDLEVVLTLDAFDVRVRNLSIDAEDKGGYPHPHVSPDGAICWGGNDDAARRFHKAGDFLAVKDVIDNLLNTYNRDSPYISLTDWERDPGEPCDSCDDYYDSDELRWSESGRIHLCEYCRAWCERCGDYVHADEFDSDMDACRSCVEDGTEVCGACGGVFWRNELTRSEIPCSSGSRPGWLCEDCRDDNEDEEPFETGKEESA